MTDKDRSAFLIEMFEQNLEHARHVEIERLSYCAASSALIVGGLAAVGAIVNDIYIDIIISNILFLISMLSLFLNGRWNAAFNEHTKCARECHKELYSELMSDNSENGEQDYYCFDIKRPVISPLRTQKCFFIYYLLMITMTFIISVWLMHKVWTGIVIYTIFIGTSTAIMILVIVMAAYEFKMRENDPLQSQTTLNTLQSSTPDR